MNKPAVAPEQSAPIGGKLRKLVQPLALATLTAISAQTHAATLSLGGNPNSGGIDVGESEFSLVAPVGPSDPADWANGLNGISLFSFDGNSNALDWTTGIETGASSNYFNFGFNVSNLNPGILDLLVTYNGSALGAVNLAPGSSSFSILDILNGTELEVDNPGFSTLYFGFTGVNPGDSTINTNWQITDFDATTSLTPTNSTSVPEPEEFALPIGAAVVGGGAAFRRRKQNQAVNADKPA